MKISVCVATYNGAKYLREQLDSIVLQLNENDEVIIVDDCSSDGTVELIKSYKDNRIRLYVNNENRGVNYSFEKAISLSEGDYIFLSDQDDIWITGRLNLMLSVLEQSGTLLLSSNFTSIGTESKPFEGYSNCVTSTRSKDYVSNIKDIYIGKLNYFGCTMAFSKKLKDVILPFPSYLESHDLWIAIAANLAYSNIHLDDITLLHRVHGNNVSIAKRPLYKKIWSRVLFSVSVIHLLKRIYWHL